VLDGLPLRVTHILDHRHAEEHLWAVARACLGDQAAAWLPRPLDALSHGRIDALLAVARALPTATAETAKLVATTCTYYDDCRAMLDYPRFRAQGYQIGSGLAESACKRLVSQREKGPGMHWTVGGAQAIATLRAAYSDRWQERSRPWPLPNGTRPLLHAHIIGGQAASLVADDSSERWVTTEAVPAVEQFFRLGTGLATQMYALHTDEDGASIAIDPWDFEGSEYERARLNSTADWGAKFCEPQQGPIVDVGSCEGVLVGRLLDRGFKIVACEPNPRFRQRLLSTPASNAVRHGLVCTSDLAGA